jgi:fatty acid desaturase
MKDTSYLRKSSVFAWLIIAWQLSLTAVAVALTLSQNLLIKIPGELLLAICILQWFILEHDLGHSAFFTYEIIKRETDD